MKKLTATIMAATVALTSGAALAMDDETMMHDKMKSKFNMMDTDKDGMISKAEYTSAKMKSFDEMDSNNDAMISMEEKKAYKMKMHDMMKEDMTGGDMKKKRYD